MATKIQWSDETWNPAVGCTHISPGCDHCYAATVASRQMQPAHVGLTVGRRWNDTVRLLPERLGEPFKWRKPRRVFVGSMTDLFHHKVPADFIDDVFGVMERCAAHTFQVLTKRPLRMARFVGRAVDVGGAPVLPNVWLGTSIESRRYAWRAEHLRRTPAAVRFLSLEPLLGHLGCDLESLDGIHWVIVGCESGPGRRPCDPDWVRAIRDRCAEAGVALFVKQLQDDAGRVLHDLEQFPADLRIREWPA